MARAKGFGLALLLALAAPAAAHASRGAPEAAGDGDHAASGFAFTHAAAAAPRPAPPPAASALALGAPGLDRIGPTAFAKSISSRDRERSGGMRVLSAERAQILLQSLTVPGWGQATLGRNGAAKVFFLIETAIWTTFAAFRIQEEMRRDSYERTARIHAGIDLAARDEEYRRIVGAFLSSDEYNLFVVYRDAANLHYDDPEAYRQYIAEHELKGADAWTWASTDDFLRYRGQRKDTQRAEQRAGTALALAVVNRFASALHASRAALRPPAAAPRSFQLEMGPAGSGAAPDLRAGLRFRF